MKCRVCHKQAVTDLCSHHQAAKENLLSAFPLWVNAYGGMEWNDYLDRVKRNVQTGRWAIEVAETMEGDG